MVNKKAIILVNTGSPNSPALPHVYRYLTKFLNDPCVIDLPAVLRFILVNLIIIPFRVRKSSRLYKRLFTKKGFPLNLIMESLTDKMNRLAGPGTEVYGLMRYGDPLLGDFLKEFPYGSYSSVTIVPLFPQYARATTGSVSLLVCSILKDRANITELRLITRFNSHRSFIRLFAALIKGYEPWTYEHLVLSYHGLPVSHITASHPGKDLDSCICEKEMPPHGSFCYKANCYETTRLIAAELGLQAGTYSTAFQSRLSKGWLSPFTDDLIRDLARAGKKRILVAAPSFVADCLETLIEIGEDYKELFLREGGEELRLVRSLNDSDEWAEALLLITEEGLIIDPEIALSF
jgi:ferrochelatase